MTPLQPLAALCLAAGACMAAMHEIPPGAEEAGIQRALAAAEDGDTISLAAGNYAITAPLAFKSGVTLSGPAEGRAVFDASAAKAPIEFKLDRLDRVTLRDLEFRNVLLGVHGTVAHNAGRDISIQSCWFRDAKRIKGEPSLFLTATYLTRLVLRDCVFLRSSAHHGNGIQLWRTHDARVENCRFGESGAEFSASDFGHFKNAIYVNGWGRPEQGENVRCVNVLLKGNVLRRSSAAVAEEDHGIYALGAKGLVIEDNGIAGWTIELTGGAIKVRNGEACILRGNRCAGSGILLYNYANVAYDLADVSVKDNTIRIAQWNEATAAYLATGITYWRDHPRGTERSIRIEHNRVENGVIVIHEPVNLGDFNADGGGIRGNHAEAIAAPAGIVQEGNTVRLAGWKIPPQPARPAAPPPAELDTRDLAENEGLVDGLNLGVLRVRTKSELLRVVLKDATVLAPDGREIMGREIILYVAKRGTRMKLTIADGKVSTLQIAP